MDIYIYIHIYINNTHTHTYIYIHIYRYICTHTHTHTHTHIYIYIYSSLCRCIVDKENFNFLSVSYLVGERRIIWFILEIFFEFDYFYKILLFNLRPNTFLGAFVNLRKATLSFVMSVCMLCPPVCLSALNNSDSTGRISIKFDFCIYFRKSFQKIQVLLKSDQSKTHIHLAPFFLE